MERLDFDLLYRWFVGPDIDVWDHWTFSKNRDRLLEGDIAAEFLATLLDRPKGRWLLLSEHFRVDGSLIQAWSSTKSIRQKDGDGEPPSGRRNPSRDFRGERHSSLTLRDKTLRLRIPALAETKVERDLAYPGGTVELSTDPALAAKVQDMVGLYLAPPNMRWCSRWTRSPMCGWPPARKRKVSVWHNQVALRSCVRPVDAVVA